MKANGNYAIRQAEKKDMDFFIAQAKKEGWNPGLNDGHVFYEADPEGFFIGELDGRPIATISAVRYNHFGFLGFHIVARGHRGKGYGLEILDHAMDYLSGCHIGLDGLVLQQSNYKKSGFQFYYPHLRFEGSTFPKPKPNDEIKSARQVDFKALSAYDSDHFPSRRESFLKSWLAMDNAESLIYQDQMGIRGMATIRKCFKGYKIGPLFAENSDIAEALFLNLTALAQSMPVYLDISQENEEALELVLRYKMNFVFEAARMYNKSIPELPREEIYGNTTFELG